MQDRDRADRQLLDAAALVGHLVPEGSGLGSGFARPAIEALQPHGRLAPVRHVRRPEGQVPLQSLYRKGLTVLGYVGLLESGEAMAAATSAPGTGRWPAERVLCQKLVPTR
jgi:hypothetical protein